jgi:alpha-amylase/alpha-mannosidase (GH57 family)
MHQPYYKDPLRGEYILPWTYLHAVKDYYDMAAIVDEVPGARAVFNFVPSLLEQLEDYAAGRAVDPFLLHGRMNPSEMSDEERSFIITNFFAANPQRLIEPNPRYLELYKMAAKEAVQKDERRSRQFRNQDILDLQVCFFLAWTGEAARRNFPELQRLVKKERNYSLEDKEILFDCQQNIVASIIPLYQKLHAEGKIELSVTPYFHPILPLLCDLKTASIAMPKVHLPATSFCHPEDARSQILSGIACFKRVFGFSPRGIWPSEGSVSDEALAIIADCGLEWAASDEGVLSASLGGLGIGHEAIYHPYKFRHDSKELQLFFRDHSLSDLIGFTYSQWDEQKAVADFINKLHSIASNVQGAKVVSVMLDGENAWEYYPDNGYHFLKGLYSALAIDDRIHPTTCSKITETATGRVLHHIHPGSWINANFGIWIGHPEKNRAWELLIKTREAAVKSNPRAAELLSGGLCDLLAESDRIAADICRDIFAAQGSDWFWWYGDDHVSSHSDLFDLLFRRHLMNVYRLIGAEIPSELYEPIKKKIPAGFVREPAGFISPHISGLVGDYFEWLAAGLYDLSKQGSTMHAAESPFRSFYYGFDHGSFYFRIDGAVPLDRQLLSEDELILYLVQKEEFRIPMKLSTGECRLQRRHAGKWIETEDTCHWAIRKICEVQVPLQSLFLDAGDLVFATLTHVRGNNELGRWPTDAPMKLMYAGAELELDTWLI